MSIALVDPIQILAPETRGAGDATGAAASYSDVLTPGALALLIDLARAYRGRVDELLAHRRDRQARFDRGELPTFLGETEEIRNASWTVAPMPAGIEDRRVEITGPVDRKMIINALNSGANVFMADFEDSTTPTWQNLIDGQRNLLDAVRGQIRHVDSASGKTYELGDRIATLFVRPRGWHLLEKHVLVDNRPVPGALFDFAIFFHNCARELTSRGKRPYFYLPKLESHLEARLWNDVFVRAQNTLGVPRGTLRATVLIETLPAAFEMDEILYELREHSAGLNCGRWDYIFSFIKKFRSHAGFVLPDRAQVTMDQPFLRSYTQLLVKTCHRRGAHAMGGMAAQIPIRNDEAASRAALDKVRADKLREVKDGHDGTWVAHPGLVSVAREIFDAHMASPNQVERQRDDVSVTADDLVRVPTGTRTEAGLVHNVRVGVQYLAAWLRGAGCVPLYHLMEDAATAEICRAQVWQWLRHGATLDDGARLTVDRFRAVLNRELSALANVSSSRITDAAQLFDELCTSEHFEEFLTLPAYDRLVALETTPQP